MDRRKFLIGAGSLAAGGAAAMGSGAFTSTEATRSLGVSIAGDGNAFLGIQPSSSANGVYAFQYGEDVEIYLEDAANLNGNMGSGVNVQAVTQIDKIFKIQNNGSQDYDIEIDDSNLPSSGTPNVQSVLTFYTGTNPDNNGIENGDVTLSPGGSVFVGIEVDLSTYGGDNNGGLEELTDDSGYGNLIIRATSA